MNQIVLAGGCFWGLQKFFDQFDGLRTQVGYANGAVDGPVSYQQVCRGSGHAEAVRIEYPDSIALSQILAAYFAAVDPTSLNRQGNDTGMNYRTGIYCENDCQLSIAKAMLKDLQTKVDGRVVIEAGLLKNYVPAEQYHQKYLDRNPGGYCHLPAVLLHGHRLPTAQEVLAEYPSVKTVL